jgi:hypothetical protein
MGIDWSTEPDPRWPDRHHTVVVPYDQEYAYVYEDEKGWWANLSGRLLGPFKTKALALERELAYQ